jgi:hypothetical protein
MASYKPVSIPNAAFIFCRYSLASLVWISFFIHSKIVLAAVCLIFLLSAILKVKRAPLVWLYTITINKIWKSADVMVNQNALFFAHIAGCILSAICLLMVCTIDKSWIWYVVLAFAALKTISAVGFCPAAKLYECMAGGSCCAFMKKSH